MFKVNNKDTRTTPMARIRFRFKSKNKSKNYHVQSIIIKATCNHANLDLLISTFQLFFISDKRSFILYARFFEKLTLLTVHIRSQKNVSFSEKFVYVINRWSPTTILKLFILCIKWLSTERATCIVQHSKKFNEKEKILNKSPNINLLSFWR